MVCSNLIVGVVWTPGFLRKGVIVWTPGLSRVGVSFSKVDVRVGVVLVLVFPERVCVIGKRIGSVVWTMAWGFSWMVTIWASMLVR